MIHRRPTRAAVEFEGDCYGKLYSKAADECQKCLVARYCRRAATNADPDVMDRKENEMMATKKAKKSAKAEKTEKAEPKGREANPLAKQYKEDKANCGFREGSAGWAVYKVFHEAIDKKGKFSVEELGVKTKAFVSDKGVIKKYGKIKFNAEAKTKVAVSSFVKLGLCRYAGEGEYEKLV
jgi:hypothetical protein